MYFTHPRRTHLEHYRNTKDILELADEYNYAIVAFDGLTGLWGKDNEDKENAETWRSWTSVGTATGLQPDGVTPTCDLDMEWDDPNREVNDCYKSQCECKNRCGLSHCADDDIQMIADFLESGELAKKLCYDEEAVFATGYSKGGIFTWNLAQDERTAKFLAGIAPIIAAPVCGYNYKAATSVPVISVVGSMDWKHPVYTKAKEANLQCKTSIRNEGGYSFVTAHKITTTFAKGAPGCKVTDEDQLPSMAYKFDGLKELTCRTWCEGEAPFSLDCYFDGYHDDMPDHNEDFAYEAAMRYFDGHLLSIGYSAFKTSFE